MSDRSSRIVAPEARGKAASFDRWIAQGGGMMETQKNGPDAGLPMGYKRTRGGQVTFKGKVVKGDTSQLGNQFSSGPMKGMSIDQARQKHAEMWDSAPEALREQYATRARRGATASEVEEAKSFNDRQVTPSRRSNDSYDDEASNQSNKPSEFASLSKAPVVPEGGIKSVGDGSSAANGWTPNTGTGGMFPRVFPNNSGAKQASRDNEVKAKDVAYKQELEKQTSADNAETDASRAAAGLPAIIRSTVTPTQASPSVAQPRPAVTTAEKSTLPAGFGSSPTPQVASPASTVIPPMIQRPAVPTAQAVSSSPKMSTSTGLPFGYRPGDDVRGQSNGVQELAAESVRRQKTAVAAPTAAVMPTRGPASQPERVGSSLDNPASAFSNAAYARTDAAMQKGTNDLSIRNGTASEATRATNPALVGQIKSDTAAMAGMSVGPSRAGQAPVSMTPENAGVKPVRKPLFASARR